MVEPKKNDKQATGLVESDVEPDNSLLPIF
jgi:hypothetical protein